MIKKKCRSKKEIALYLFFQTGTQEKGPGKAWPGWRNREGKGYHCESQPGAGSSKATEDNQRKVKICLRTFSNKI